MLVDVRDSPEVVAVIPTLGYSMDRLNECIQRLVEQRTPIRLAIVVVANSINDRLNSSEQFMVLHPGLNLGWAGALSYARSNFEAPYMWLIHDDLFVAPDCLSRLMEELDARDDVAVMSPVARDSVGRILLGSLGGVISSSGEVQRLVPDSARSGYDWHSASDLSFVFTAGAVVRVRDWDLVSGMDIRYYPLAWTDADFCLALSRADRGFAIAPSAHVTHAEGSSTPRELGEFLDKRNEALFASKWFNARGEERDLLDTAHPVAPNVSRDLLELVAQAASDTLVHLGAAMEVQPGRRARRQASRARGPRTVRRAAHRRRPFETVVAVLGRQLRQRRLRSAVLDVDFYRRAYPDLRLMTPEEATIHWRHHGQFEQRVPSQAELEIRLERRGLVLNDIDIAQYVIDRPYLVEHNATTYEAAMLWLDSPEVPDSVTDESSFVSLPREFLDALEKHDIDRSERHGAAKWEYRSPTLTPAVAHSSLAEALSKGESDQFVLEAFRHFIGHTPSARGLQTWVTLLDSHTYSRAAVVSVLLNAGPRSREAFAHSTSRQEIAEESIRQAMNALETATAPDAVELMGITVTSRTEWYEAAFQTVFGSGASLDEPRLSSTASSSHDSAAAAAKIQPTESHIPPRPRVSVLVTLYKSDAHLASWIRNAIELEGFGRTEFIIIAVDPSPYELELLSELASRHSNVILQLRSYPCGIYEAWNAALSIASAEYVTNMNVDDIRAPSSLVAQASILDKYDWADVVYQDVHMSLSADLQWNQLEQIGTVCQLPVTTTTLLISGPNPPHNGPMWRRCLHEEVGTFDETLRSAADFEFWIRCARMGKRFFNVPESHVGYFQNPDGMSTSREGVGLREGRQVLDRYRNELLSDPPPSFVVERDEFTAPHSRATRLSRDFVAAVIARRMHENHDVVREEKPQISFAAFAVPEKLAGGFA